MYYMAFDCFKNLFSMIKASKKGLNLSLEMNLIRMAADLKQQCKKISEAFSCISF